MLPVCGVRRNINVIIQIILLSSGQMITSMLASNRWRMLSYQPDDNINIVI